MSVFEKLEAATENRDVDAYLDLMADDAIFVRHQTGETLDKAQAGEMLRRMLSSGGATLAVEEGEPVDAVPGTTDDFQVWYRDVGGPCGSMFNLSNGVEVPWLL